MISLKNKFSLLFVLLMTVTERGVSLMINTTTENNRENKIKQINQIRQMKQINLMKQRVLV